MNRLHWRQEVILRGDASPIRTGAAPQAMATQGNTLGRIARDFAGPVAEVREIAVENRVQAITAVKNGSL